MPNPISMPRQLKGNPHNINGDFPVDYVPLGERGTPYYEQGNTPTIIDSVSPSAFDPNPGVFGPKPSGNGTTINSNFVDSQNEYTLNGPIPTNSLPVPTTAQIINRSGSNNQIQAPDYSALDSLYANMDQNTANTGTNNQALYDAALANITGNYQARSADRFQQYQNSRDILTGQAKNLGVNYDSTQMGQGYDTDLRRIQETSDQNLNIDQSWIEKMKTLGADNINAMRLGLQAELVNRKAAQAAALLASRHSGGGFRKSSSNGSNLTSTDTYTQENPEYMSIYNELAGKNSAAANMLDNAYWNTETPEKGVMELISHQGSKPPTHLIRRGDLAVAKHRINNDLAIAAMQALTAKGANSSHKREIKEKN